MSYLTDLFKKRQSESPDVLQLKPDGKEIPYGDVTGFFKFRGKIYYRSKGVAGRTINKLSLSFTESIRSDYPDEFENMLAKNISKLLVQPLTVEE